MNEFGGDLIDIVDDDGNETSLEIVGEVEYEDRSFTVFVPANIDEMDPSDPDYGYIILENFEKPDGTLEYGSIDDEETLTAVYDTFMDMLDEEEGEEDGE